MLFDSPESAYFLKNESLDDDGVEEYCREITLRPGEVMEVEWLGSEYVYADEATPGQFSPLTSCHEQYDKIRLGKLIPIKSVTTTKAGYLELYSGWVQGKVIPWAADDTLRRIRITPIKGKMRSKLDFSKLFSSDNAEDEEAPVDFNRNSTESEPFN